MSNLLEKVEKKLIIFFLSFGCTKIRTIDTGVLWIILPYYIIIKINKLIVISKQINCE